MKTSCLVNNYNYAQFVCEAVDSALRQTVPFDEIIVVDDGSKDGSVELLASRYGTNPTVKVFSKRNEGQLSSFNDGFAHSSGDVIFFLDADDIYEPDYVERAIEVFQRHNQCDFVFCARQLFGQQNRLVMKYPEDRDVGYSVIRTAHKRSWVGACTSCLSMRRSLLQKILPLPFLDEWRVRADECLVFGSSLAGARKRFLARPLVRYRVHGKNHYCGRKQDRFEVFRRRLALNRMFEHYERSLCINFDRLADAAHREFLTIEQPSVGDLITYARITMGSRARLMRRVGYVAEMLLHLASSKRNHRPGSMPETTAAKPADILPLRPTAQRSPESLTWERAG